MLDAGVRSRCTNGSGRMERLRGAGDRAVKTTVEQTLMRGLATACPCVRPGLPRSASGRQGRASAPQFLRGFPTEALPPALRNGFCRSKLIGDPPPRRGARSTSGRARLNRVTDRPEKGCHFAAIAVVTRVWRLPSAGDSVRTAAAEPSRRSLAPSSAGSPVGLAEAGSGEPESDRSRPPRSAHGGLLGCRL